jgi:hypothetical protein
MHTEHLSAILNVFFDIGQQRDHENNRIARKAYCPEADKIRYFGEDGWLYESSPQEGEFVSLKTCVNPLSQWLIRDDKPIADWQLRQQAVPSLVN